MNALLNDRLWPALASEARAALSKGCVTLLTASLIHMYSSS